MRSLIPMLRSPVRGRRLVALTILSMSAFVSGCGTIICMDGPCDAVVADAYARAVFTPNDFSRSRSTEETVADIDQCRTYAAYQELRLLAELRDADPYLDEYAARKASTHAIGDSAGRTAANTDIDTSGSGVRVSGGGASSRFEEDMAGAAGSLAASIILGTGYDESKQPLMDLEEDLIDKETQVRLKYTCLRQKGYRIDEYAEDGVGTVSVDTDELLVVIHRSDCIDVPIYKRPLPDDGLPVPTSSEECTPGETVLLVAPEGFESEYAF